MSNEVIFYRVYHLANQANTNMKRFELMGDSDSDVIIYKGDKLLYKNYNGFVNIKGVVESVWEQDGKWYVNVAHPPEPREVYIPIYATEHCHSLASDAYREDGSFAAPDTTYIKV